MRKILIALLIVIGIGYLFIGFAHEKEKQCQGTCQNWAKEVQIEIKNLEDGVVILATSNNPDVVPLIQNHAVNCMTRCKHNFCPHACSGQCKKTEDPDESSHDRTEPTNNQKSKNNE